MTVSPTARLVKGTDEITSILLAILAHKSLAAFSLGTRMSARHPPHHPPSPLPFPCLQLTVSRLHVLIKFVRPCARAGSLQGDPTLPAYLVQTMAFAAARWITASSPQPSRLHVDSASASSSTNYKDYPPTRRP